MVALFEVEAEPELGPVGTLGPGGLVGMELRGTIDEPPAVVSLCNCCTAAGSVEPQLTPQLSPGFHLSCQQTTIGGCETTPFCIP